MEIKLPSAIVDSMAAFCKKKKKKDVQYQDIGRAARGLMVMQLQDRTVPRRAQCDQSPE